MYYVSNEELWHMHTLLFRHGLTGGCQITPVQLENGVNVSKDIHYLYSNKDVCVTFFYKRCASGVWYDLCRIRFENMKTNTIITFNRKEGE